MSLHTLVISWTLVLTLLSFQWAGYEKRRTKAEARISKHRSSKVKIMAPFTAEHFWGCKLVVVSCKVSEPWRNQIEFHGNWFLHLFCNLSTVVQCVNIYQAIRSLISVKSKSNGTNIISKLQLPCIVIHVLSRRMSVQPKALKKFSPLKNNQHCSRSSSCKNPLDIWFIMYVSSLQSV